MTGRESSPPSQEGRRRVFRLLLGTANRHKLAELSGAIEAALSSACRQRGGEIQVSGAAILPPAAAVAETGSTFLENARLKTKAYATRADALPPGERPLWVAADDSGLCVDALGGEPGVHSARYAGPGASDRDNNEKLLSALRGVPPEQRGAEFACVLACVGLPPAARTEEPDGPPLLFWAEGRCRGEILTQTRGTGGFGYDPLFFIPALGKSFAELTGAEKHQISHRGRALRLFCEELAKELRKPAMDP